MLTVGVTVAVAGLNDTITTMIPLINHVNFASFSVAEHVKIMIDQFKLLQSLLHGHGRHGKVLHPHHFGRQFGGTIAHGLLTLSLIVHLCLDFVPRIRGTQLLVNYGFDKVRFPAPVRVGKRIRATATLAEVHERKPGQILLKLDVTIEIEGETKPALTAEWLSLHVLG